MVRTPGNRTSGVIGARARYEWSVSSRQLSAVSHQPSAVSLPPSAGGLWLAAGGAAEKYAQTLSPARGERRENMPCAAGPATRHAGNDRRPAQIETKRQIQGEKEEIVGVDGSSMSR